MAKIMIQEDDEIFGRTKNEMVSCKILIKEGSYTDSFNSSLSKVSGSIGILLLIDDNMLVLGKYKKAGYWIIIKSLIGLDPDQLKIMLDLHEKSPRLRLK